MVQYTSRLFIFFNLFLVPTGGQCDFLWDEALARKLVQLSIKCVEREFPNDLERRESKPKPKKAHPAFFGCYDWHSAVHGHWAMVRVLSRFPAIVERAEIERIFKLHFNPQAIEGEIRSFEKKPAFEIPYGYAWYFQLRNELLHWNHPSAKRWFTALDPLEPLLIKRLSEYLQKLSRPMREGHHSNTAFSLALILEYANRVGHIEFKKIIENKSREFFLKDRHCPIEYEPSAQDFLSPCLAEARLMNLVLPTIEFKTWWESFATILLDKNRNVSFLEIPVLPTDPKDPSLGHLIGLMFHKASTLAFLLPFVDSSTKEVFGKGVKAHEKSGLTLMRASGYGGEHWLATFAIHHFSQLPPIN